MGIYMVIIADEFDIKFYIIRLCSEIPLSELGKNSYSFFNNTRIYTPLPIKM